MKKLLSVLLTVMMLVAIVTVFVTTANADDALTEITHNSNTYYTNEDGMMAYNYISSYFDIIGKFDGSWKSTTYGNGGYRTYLKQGNDITLVIAESTENYGDDIGNLNVAIDFVFANDGKTLQIVYTVKNNGTSAETFSLGSGADIKIGVDDSAVITPFDSDGGFKMVSDAASDKNDAGDYAQFNFFGKGYKGVTPVSDFWYGHWNSDYTYHWSSNYTEAVFYKNEYSEAGNFDSAASWHWADQTIAAGATKTYSVIIGIGGAESEEVVEEEPTTGFTVVYTDGVDDEIIFENQEYTVEAGEATPAFNGTPTRKKYVFGGWEPEVADTVTGDVTYVAQWIPVPNSSFVTNELFTIQCTEVHEHSWLCNWFGSHVKFVTDSIKYNDQLDRWEAQCKIGSTMLTQINISTTKKNYFGGFTHHYDETNFVFDLYYDPDYTGLNSAKKEVTGMWLPADEYVVDVYCYTAPAMPNISKITSTVIWVRDAVNKNLTHSQKFTVKQLLTDTYELGQMYTENGKFYVDLTITDIAPYIEALKVKTGKEYLLPEWEKHYTEDDFKFTLEYTGKTDDYKQDGTGWSVAASSWANNSEKLNGKSLWLTEEITVTYVDGYNEKYFATEEYTVLAVYENGKTANAVTDFTATATPAFAGSTNRQGYRFIDWSPAVAATVSTDVTYTAQWVANDDTLYTVKHYFEELDGTYREVVEYKGGTTDTLTSAEAKDEPGFTAQPFEQVNIEPDESAVVEIYYTRNSYVLTFVPENGEDDIISIVKFGAPITAPTLTKTGYTFAGWDVKVPATMPANDVTYTAQWTANEYIIVFEAVDGRGSMKDQVFTYDEAQKLSKNKFTNAGFDFIGWSYEKYGKVVFKDCEEVLNLATEGTVTLYAQWKLKPNYLDVNFYLVSVADADHGDVSIYRKMMPANTTVTLFVEPDNGYMVDTVLVTTFYGKVIKVNANSDGTYSFKMPAGNVKVTVDFAEIPKEEPTHDCPMTGFADLDQNAWYHEGVDYVLSNKLMIGTSDTTFAPNATLNRAMLVTVLWRLEGEPVVNYAMSFADVEAETWYTEAVRWAASEGIVNGFGDDTFKPLDNLTREQLATILYRYEQKKGGGFTGMWMFNLEYSDAADVSDWAYEAVCWMTMNKIYVERDGLLATDEDATRAEAAVMLQRYCEK